MNEEWRDVPGCEGIYSVSNLGRVRRDGGGQGARAGRILKPRPNRDGHLRVALYRNGIRQMLVHRLVMAAFVGPCPPGQEVAHANGTPTDNRLANLRYDTRSENSLDVHRHGRKFGGQKLALEQVAEIRARLATGETQRSIARAYGVNQQTISHINTGKSWGHLLDQDGVANRPE